MQKVSLIGKRFGKLVVIEETDKRTKNHKVIWKCRCDCGNLIEVSGADLGRHTNSCGCMSSRHSIGERTKTHGMSKTHLYGVWCAMRDRCDKPNTKSYKDYGAKGVRVCDKWKSFEEFYSDMGATYKQGLTIERIDVNGNYCPENCTWITKFEQAANKRNTKLITYNGYTSHLADICRHFNIPFPLIRGRLYKGWDIVKALDTPVRVQKHKETRG